MGRILGLGAPPAVDLSMNIPPQPASANLKRLIPETIASLLSEEHGMLNLHIRRAPAATWIGPRLRLGSAAVSIS